MTAAGGHAGGAVEAAAALLGDAATRDAPLGARTTYRVGGTAALLVEVADDDALAAVAAAVRASGVPVLVLGKGSNLLVADAGFAGLVVVLGEAFAVVEIDGTTVRAGGAASLPVVARRTVAAGLAGLEWAVGVPGSVGGAVRMNAGGHGAETSATLVRVRVVDLATGEDVVMSAADLDLGYRVSAVATTQVVVWAEHELAAADRAVGEAALAEVVRWRREHQPGGQNAGSVFTNPPGDSAGRLIEAAGCKGLRIGTAEVSTKHANFVQADPGGSADDVVAVIQAVRARVERASGIVLHTENLFVGNVFVGNLVVDVDGDPRPKVEG